MANKVETAYHLAYIFEEAMDLVRARDESYGEYWLTEDIESVAQNVFRKAEGFKNLFRNGARSTPQTREHLVDLINYAAMTLYRLDRESEENKEQ